MMKTIVKPPTPEAIAEAARIIRSGGLVGMPTETVYGLAADALNERAVQSIFDAKERPADNPLIVHISRIGQLGALITDPVPASAQLLIDACWPGPLTLIFPKSNRVPAITTAGLQTVAIRLPAHPVAHALIDAAGVPIAAPSANRSGKPSTTTAAHVLADMDGKIPLILDGGNAEVGLESTVVDATGAIPRVLRPGGVTAERIVEIAGAVEVDGSVLRPLDEHEAPRSPGMKYRHYAPQGELTVVRGAPERVASAICARYDRDPERSAILALPENAARYGARYALPLGESGRAEDVAAALYGLLRRMDEEDVRLIYAESIEGTGVGLAVMNRLCRAAAFQIIDV